MSESKLCPLALVVGYESATHLYCLREKCAWWVKKIRLSEHVNVQTGYRDEFEAGSHCVILDLGKAARHDGKEE